MNRRVTYRQIRRNIIDAFDFSRKQYRGIIVLTVVLILFFFLRLFIAQIEKSHAPIESDNLAIRSFLQQQKNYQDSILSARNERTTSFPYNQKEKSEKKELTPFPFDPNTMIFSDWQRLGFTEKQAQQITNYQSRGGYFHDKTDLKKIYCITEENYQILEPYILITPKPKQETKAKEALTFPKIELNGTDNIELQKIPGIGQKTAARIINYRESLGGYTNINQLKEVYAVDSSRFLQISPYLYVNSEHTQKININKASIKELIKHPYIEYYLAKAIVNYREQHGNYTEVKDIKKAVHFYDELYQKIEPYLSVE
jgi:competence ComEA-like helix-hairpin-helix protein